jgi:MoaA/NifB/PqqE/SkfB family radical SAM enzyme
MKRIKIPKEYNYIALFLTLRCNLNCPYCINRFDKDDFKVKRVELTGRQWADIINRIESFKDLPITFQGGEPTLHNGFYDILENTRQDIKFDLLTNLEFDINLFMDRVSPDRFKRDAPYASIRISYHPGMADPFVLADKTSILLNKGYSVGVWMVDHPEWAEHLSEARKIFESKGIDFRTKEFLGFYDNKLYGTYKYPNSLSGRIIKKSVQCRTSELIAAPDGRVYKCHSDLYAARDSIGNLLDSHFEVQNIYRDCPCFGLCNPCDVKIKTNRFQEYGHTSVDIKLY